MRIKESTFNNGGEVDYPHRSFSQQEQGIAFSGRPSLRKCGREYQIYVCCRTLGPQYLPAMPRVEIILYETRSLKDAVQWADRALGAQDTYEEGG